MPLGSSIHVGLFVMLLAVRCSAPAQAPDPVPIFGTGIDVDLSGNLIVVDGHNATICLYDRAFVKGMTAGGPGWENGRFDQPAGIWARNGLDVFVADFGNHRIQRFDRTLSFVSSFSTRDSDDPSGRFGYPSDVALSRFGELFLCDTENGRIVKVNAANKVEASFGGFGGGQGRLQHPAQVEIGPNDRVYVLDPPRVLVFDGFGNFLTAYPDGVMSHPTVLFADTRGVMIADGDSLFCFDNADRLLALFSFGKLLGRESTDVRSMVVAGRTLYVLSGQGLFVLRDPRE